MIIAFLSALGIYIAQKLGVDLSFFLQNYWNDLMVIPLVLFIERWVLSKLYQQPTFRLSAAMIIVMVFFYSLLFEGIFPLYFPRYTADGLDVVMYGLGGLGYALWQSYFITSPRRQN